MEKDPNAVIAANNLAWLYAVTGKGNIDEALRLAQGVVQKNPNVAGFVDTLGWVYYKKNLHAAAVEQLRKAVSINEAEARAANGTPSASLSLPSRDGVKRKGRQGRGASRTGSRDPTVRESSFAELEEAKKTLASLIKF